ncbi:MAG: DNA translocase FtsK 4TM domain-containing protein [Candidatus Dojkabacteria bacterium]|nr:MAG: DNA translocase FtsK 4TM domain-containing protein [Candidatus Dojkabacteria bacterium]
MGRRKKATSEITIHSKETRIILGLFLILIALTLIAAPFSTEAVFEPIVFYLGVPSVAWGILILLMAIRVIKGPSKFTNWKTITGTLLIALILNILFTFWIPEEILSSQTDFSNEGGQLGYILHTQLNAMVGDFIEFVLIIVLIIVAFSLISGVSLERISNSVGNLFDKLFESRNKLKLPKGEDDDGISIVDSMFKGGDDDEAIDEAIEPEIENGAEPIANMRAKTEPNMSANVEAEIREATGKEFVESPKSNSKESSEEESSTLSEPLYPNWKFPPVNLLQKPQVSPQDPNLHKRNASVIEKTSAQLQY